MYDPSLNPTERCAVNAMSIRDLNPLAYVLATFDGAWTPLRQAAFGDMNFDRTAEIPKVFPDRAAAEAGADWWNGRLPDEYKITLGVQAMPIGSWCARYLDVLDPSELESAGHFEGPGRWPIETEHGIEWEYDND